MTDPQQDIKELLAAAHAGSSEALGRVLDSCRKYLLQIACQDLDPALQGKGAPSDIVQETLPDAQRDVAQFHGSEEGELRAWLRRLLLNNVADFTRRYQGTEKRQTRREVPLEGETRSEHPEGGLA